MKTIVGLAAVVSGLIALPHGASAITVWQGDAVVTAANANCSTPGEERRTIGVGTVLKSVYRPRAVDGNGPTTRLSFVHDSGALFALIFDGNLAAPRPTGDFTGYGATHSGMMVANRFAGYTSYTQSPATVTADTVFVTISARVEDFLFLDGCDATFRAAFSRR